ncbi:MAG TPA: hypothetical protein VIJ82_33490 [Streptosporangiaceae bacterium]
MTDSGPDAGAARLLLGPPTGQLSCGADVDELLKQRPTGERPS